MGKEKKMSIKEENFCQIYAANGNATQAYKDAGYKWSNENVAGVTGWRMLQKPKIQRRIKEIAAERRSERIADIDEMQERLTKIIRGEGTRDNDRTKAIELMLKVQGALFPKQQDNSDISITVNVGDG